MKNLVKLFVNRYVASISVFGALVLFGLVSVLGIGIDLFPEIEIPIVAVSTVYPGAGSEEIARQVSEPIEGSLSTLPGISNVTSTSSEGFSIVIAEFNTGVDIDQAAIDVSQRINTVVGSLPSDATSPTVQKFDPNDQPILGVAVSAPGEDLGAVQAYVEDNVQPQLQRVDGVADVSVTGPSDREVQVLLDPNRLESYGLSPTQVVGAIGGSALDLPIGDLSFSGSRVLLSGRNTPANLKAIEDIQVDSARGVRVVDVATVRDSAADVNSYARVNGEPVVLVQVQKISGSNSVASAANVRAAIEGLELPAGYSARVINDTTLQTSATVDDTIIETLIAVAAVAVVVMFFVGRLGTILAVVLSIPISIAGAFIVFGLMGFTFNLITLLAITVAVGLVVDDSIVVAENIDRFQNMGYARKDAVIQGAGEVSAPVLAATLSLLAVFLPISFLPGIIGDFFAQFGLAMAAMIFFSYLASMFFLTMVLAYLPNPLPPGWKDLPKAAGQVRADLGWTLGLYKRVWFYVLLVALGAALLFLLGPVWLLALLAVPVVLFLIRYVGRLVLYFLGAIFLTFYQAGVWATDRLRDGYAASLRASLKYSWAVLLGAVLLLSTLAFVFPRVGFVFTADQDTDQLTFNMTLPTGSPLDSTNALAFEVEQTLRSDPRVELVQSSVGGGGGGLTGGASGPEGASMNITLVEEREEPADAIALELEQEIGVVLANYPEVEYSVSKAEGGGPPTSSTYTLDLSSADLDLLLEREADIRTVLQESDDLRNVESTLAASVSERVFVIDQSSLTGTGLNAATIYQTLRTYNTGAEAAKLRSEGEEFPIIVSANPQFVRDEQALLGLPILLPATGAEVPIGQFGSFETRDTPASVSRSNRAYSLTFSADLAVEASELGRVQNELRGDLRSAGLIDGRVYENNAGTLDLLGDLLLYGPIAFALALLLNYLVIGTQFNSFKFPLYLLITVPLALVGAVWLLYAFNTPLDIISVLGVIMLIGLVTKNAILLLEVLMEQISENGGKVASLKDALVEAGRLRFRPIIMTTVTIVIISVPLLLGIGEGSEFRYGLGVVILGGVITSTLLTFYVVPAAFYQFERKNFEEGAGGTGSAVKTPEPKPTAPRQPALPTAPQTVQSNT